MPSFDHLVYATPDLDATVAELADQLGVAALSGGSHPGQGTRNALYALDTGGYLELIGPDENQEAAPRWFGIASLSRPCLVGWAIQVEQLNRVVAEARGRGYDPGNPVGMSRQADTGEPIIWRLTMPLTTMVPFLIEWADTPHPTSRNLPLLSLESFAGEHPEPEALSATLDTLGVALPLSRQAQPRLVATVSGPGGRVELS